MPNVTSELKTISCGHFQCPLKLNSLGMGFDASSGEAEGKLVVGGLKT